MAVQQLWQDFYVWTGSEQPQKKEPWLMSFACCLRFHDNKQKFFCDDFG